MKRSEFNYLKFKDVDLSTSAYEVYYPFIDFCKTKLEKRIVRVIVRLRAVNGNGKRDIEKSI